MKVCSFFILFYLICSCNYGQIKDKGAHKLNQTNNKFSKDTINYSIVNAQSNTYGYKIAVNNKTIIKQLTIPGQAGLKGFKTAKAAAKTAELVIKKIKNGDMPPTVTLNELKVINAIE